jgi:hypothetical protein
MSDVFSLIAPLALLLLGFSWGRISADRFWEEFTTKQRQRIFREWAESDARLFKRFREMVATESTEVPRDDA